jgi:hypothetical protein
MPRYFRIDNNLFEFPDILPRDAAFPATGEVTVEEFNGAMSGKVTAVGSSLTLPKLINATSIPGSIVKAGSTLAWDAGGWGDKAGTFLLWQASTVQAQAILGWTATPGNVDWKSISHGLYISSNALSVYELGVEKARSSFNLTDLLTITLAGTSVVYAKNSQLLFTSSRQAGDLLPAVLLRSSISLSNLKFA